MRVYRTDTVEPSSIEQCQKQEEFCNRNVAGTAEPEDMSEYELKNDINYKRVRLDKHTYML